MALLDAQDGHIIERIDAFDDTSGDQAGGDFDGSYAVWKEYSTPGSLDDYVVKEWNASTGAVTEVGASHHTSDGQVISSTWEDPVLGAGYAAWVEGLDEQGGGELVVLDLASGQRTIVRKGHPGWAGSVGDVLFWAESPTPGAETRVRAYDVGLGKDAPVPTALAGARGAWGFASDGTSLAWAGGDSRSLYYAPDPNTKPAVVGHLRQGGFSPPLSVAGHVVAAPVSAGGLLLANGETNAYTLISGAALATRAGHALLLGAASTSKTQASTAAYATLTADAVGQIDC